MARSIVRVRQPAATQNLVVAVSLTLLAACSQNSGTTGSGAGGSGPGGHGVTVGGAGGGTGAAGPGGAGVASGTGGQTTGAGGGLVVGAGGSGGAAADAGAAGAGGGAAGATSAAGGAVGSAGSGGAPVGTSGQAGSSGSGGISGAAGAATMPVACQSPAAVTGTAVSVAVNVTTTRATVGADMMGIYAAVYDNNFRAPTTPPLLQAAGVRAIRYPGGSYADVYHWETATASIQNKGSASETMPYVAANTDFGSFIGLIESVGATGIITVNYGSNPQGTGPGVPQEAAAWVAYANGSPSNTLAIGVDSSGADWKTVGYWAGLRAADKLAVDDGSNFLRISHPTPVGIKYWEVGNELYGNGYYYGGEGWEEDLHLLHNGTPRTGNANLSPAKYGQVFPSFAQAMKAVDPTVQVGAIVHWPYTEYASPNATDWNSSVLTAATCAAMDFGINHWYAGQMTLTDLLTRPRTDIPMMYSALQAKVKALCPSKAGTIPIAVTEWGPNYLSITNVTPPAQTQLIGVFAADSYATFMEQGAINVDWLEIHNNSYLDTGDVPTWGYHGQQMAGYLANAGDAMVQATVQTTAAAFNGGLFQAHASQHADGSVAVMLVNTSPTTVAAATVTVAGLAAGAKLPCVGTRYAYTPGAMNADGVVAAAPIFSTNDANNRVAVAVPAYSVVVVVFPKP
jgi:hypothetical protein